MKFIKIGLIAFVLSFIFVQVAFAQDNDPDIPQSAVEALDMLAVFLASVAALVANAVTDWVKTWSWLKPEDQEKVGGSLAQIIAVLSSAGIGAAISFLHPIAVNLDDSGIWTAILAVLAVLVSKGLFELEGFRKAIAARVG